MVALTPTWPLLLNIICCLKLFCMTCVAPFMSLPLLDAENTTVSDLPSVMFELVEFWKLTKRFTPLMDVILEFDADLVWITLISLIPFESFDVGTWSRGRESSLRSVGLTGSILSSVLLNKGGLLSGVRTKTSSKTPRSMLLFFDIGEVRLSSSVLLTLEIVMSV